MTALRSHHPTRPRMSFNAYLSLRYLQNPIMADFCKLAKNINQESECYGCQIIGSMFRKRHDLDSSSNPSCSVTCKFHNSFPELECCAKKGCGTCRVFQRAPWLRQITKQEADRLRNSHQQGRVSARLGLHKLEVQQTTQAERSWKLVSVILLKSDRLQRSHVPWSRAKDPSYSTVDTRTMPLLRRLRNG